MLDVDKLLESPPIDTSQKDFWDYDIESLLARHSAFTSLADLVKAQQENGYIPTIDTRRDKGTVKAEKTALANELTRRGINVYHDGKFDPAWDNWKTAAVWVAPPDPTARRTER